MNIMMSKLHPVTLSGLRSHSPSRRTCILAVALRACSHGLGLAEVHIAMHMTCNHHEIFECAHLIFTVSGWCKQTYSHNYIHTSAMQSR